MKQITVNKKNGMVIQLIDKAAPCTVTSAVQEWALNGEERVKITVRTAVPLDLGIGDSVEAFGRIYKMNRLPKVSKTKMHLFIYECEFEGIQYDLLRVTYDLTVDTTDNELQDVSGDSFTGNLNDFMRILIANANRVFPGKWLLGECPDTDVETMTFGESDNCLSVLQALCDRHDMQFEIVHSAGMYTIDIKQVGQILPYTFRYGNGKGLYSLTRENVSSSNIITRLKVRGSSENITSKYRSDRLLLPGKTKGQSYIEDAAAVARYGVYEATKNFDVKPTFTGTVAAEGLQLTQFSDPSVNFDLNAKDDDGNTIYLLPGTAAVIHFNTGNLAGYEFEIAGYDHETHTFRIKKFTDGRGMTFPSETSAAFRFGAGDEYKILQIALPDEVIGAAESRLQEEAFEYYQQNSQPRVKYSLSVTKAYLESLVGGGGVIVNVFTPGDYLPIKDDDIGVDKSVRIKEFTRNLLDEYDYRLTISDTITTNITAMVISELKEIDKAIEMNALRDPARARANWRTSRELLDMVFDTEGDYYTDRIKPMSIDTQLLAVGAKSMQFGLAGTVFRPNHGGNANSMAWDGGVLTHYAVVEDGTRSWVMADGSVTFAQDVPYYLYAKCPKADGETGGVFVFATEQIKVEDDPDYWHFLIGAVSSVSAGDGVRTLSLTYGFSMINGRFIKTGRIESADGNTYFDLDDGEIGGRIVFTSDGQEKTLQQLGEETAETNDYINNTLPVVMDGLQGQIDGKIESWFQSSNPATAWTTPELKAKHVGDMWYSGTTNLLKQYSSTYSWITIEDKKAIDAYALANTAKDTADGKRRVFISTPYTPYDEGDLWTQGATGDIMRCVNGRQTGNYTASDWEKASKYTGDSALNTFVEVTYAGDIGNIEGQIDGLSGNISGLQGQIDGLSGNISGLQGQIDGKIESWFQSSNPATAWTTPELKAKHVGDMWYNPTAKSLKRYSSSYAWEEIQDQKAVDAYALASTAKDTADGKRRVFVTTPAPPYDIGDLWLNGTDIRRSTANRATGDSYNPNDWIIPVHYDNTQTVIDGGIVTSGTVQVAGSSEQSYILAGITGQGTAGTSVRFWAGAAFENRATAPFRVRQDGSFFASKAFIEGDVRVNGAVKSPFRLIDWTTGAQGALSANDYHDNILVDPNSTGLQTMFLVADVENIGRRITVIPTTAHKFYIRGVKNGSAISSDCFFENGAKSYRLTCENESVELIGVGDSVGDPDESVPPSFSYWMVVRRTSMAPPSVLPLNVLAYGKVYGQTSNGSCSLDVKTFDGENESAVTAIRASQGIYSVTFPSDWGLLYSSAYMVMLTGYGAQLNTSGNTAPVKATLYARSTSSFTVHISDTDVLKDGDFQFIMFRY